MRINHNLAAMNTHRQLALNTMGANKSLEKLSSGFRINRAGDDAAGLAISEKMRGQIRGLDQASRNAQDAISLIQTAEGALSTTHNILQRMRELAVQSANDTSTDGDRAQLQKEITQLKAEVDRVAYTTEFNSKKLLNGSLTATKVAQGTLADSSNIDAIDTAASAGTTQGGAAITERGSVQTITGTGLAKIGFNALDEKIVISTGVNDRFRFTVNGVAHMSGQIAASTGSGYTRAEFADAVEAAFNARLTISGNKVERNQVVVTVTSDNKLQVTTAQASRISSLTILSGGTGNNSGTNSALSAMGMKGYQTTIESTLDLSNGITFTAASSGNFVVKLGTKSGTVTLQAGVNYSKTTLINAIQSGLNTIFGAGIVKIGDSDSDGKLELSTTVKATTFAVRSGTAGASGKAYIFGVANGTTLSGGRINSGTLTTVSGTNTIRGYATGINIANGVNDQFRIAVDGGAAETITLSTKLYATKLDLVNEVNNQIGSNVNLTGKVQAQLDSSNKIVFTSTSTGPSSAVIISDPAAAAQSALGALGFGPTRGIISGTKNIASGIGLSGTLNSVNNYKFTVVLGNKSATINLLDQDNIVDGTTSVSGKTTRDALVNAFQAELDAAFGANAINVSTRQSGTQETLRFSTITAAAKFSIQSITGFSGVQNMLSGAGTGIKSGALSTTPTNVLTAGTAAIDNTLASNTLLTGLSDGDNNNLGLSAGNVITFAGTQNGVEFSTSLTVNSTSTIGDLLGKVRALDAFTGATVSLNTTDGLIRVLGKTGEQYDLSNLRFSAQKSSTDSTAVGNFNRAFGSFDVSQVAQDAASDSSLNMQIGANQGQAVSVDLNNVSAGTLKVSNIDVSSKAGAQSAISVVNNALESVSEERAKLGAIQNRLEYTISNLGTSSENLTASESRIRDVDMAKEMMEFTKNNILSQAAQAMLAQANQQPQGVLQLLR